MREEVSLVDACEYLITVLGFQNNRSLVQNVFLSREDKIHYESGELKEVDGVMQEVGEVRDVVGNKWRLSFNLMYQQKMLCGSGQCEREMVILFCKKVLRDIEDGIEYNIYPGQSIWRHSITEVQTSTDKYDPVDTIDFEPGQTVFKAIGEKWVIGCTENHIQSFPFDPYRYVPYREDKTDG